LLILQKYIYSLDENLKSCLVYCRVPYLALAKTLEAIEGVSARLKIIEILANYFRSVIVLSPEDLLPSVYLCLNKLAPAYEGIFFAFFFLLWPLHNLHFWFIL